MQPGALLASLANAVSSQSRGRRRLAGCGRPLAALAVLVIGAVVFSSVAALLGTRQPAAVFHAAAETPRDGLHALPAHVPSALRDAGFDETLARLKEGAFGIAFALPASAATAGAPAREKTLALAPSVLVDRTLPPLRIDIMGLDQAPLAAFLAAGAPLP